MYVDGTRSDYDAVAAGIRDTFATLRSMQPSFTNVEVNVLSPESAVVSLAFRDVITDADGKVLRSRGATTLVWVRQGTQWLITYAHADHYPDPEP